MYYAQDKKWEKIHSGRNRTAKLGKHQDACREGKLQVIDNTGSGDARGVMVIVVGNGHGNTSSNPGPG